MSEYQAPLAEMRFALEHVADIQALCDLDAFPDASPDLVFSALEEASRFTSEVVAPLYRSGDVEGSRLDPSGSVVTPEGFKKAYHQYVAAGWGGVPFPPQYGGHGMPRLVGFVVHEMFKTSNLAFSLCPLLTASAIEALLAHGTEEQRQLYLGKLITGEWAATMNLTEPHAGSDLGVINTKAVPLRDGTYSISGTKIFITWGEHDLTDNIIHLVLAKTPGAPAGTKGISMFLVPKYLPNPDGSLGERNDVRCVSIEHKLGIHASPTCVMSYGEAGGAVGYLIGEESEGMHYMFTMMNAARIGVGGEGLAVSERAYQMARRYAQERRQGRAIGNSGPESSLIIDHPDVQRMLITMKASIEAMRGLLYIAGEALDLSYGHPDHSVREHNLEFLQLITPVCKAWCTDMGVRLSSIGLQVHGGMGYVEETGAAQVYRDARITPIYEGTNGIQAVDLVGRKVPMRNGDVARELFARVESDADSLGTSNGRLKDIRENLVAALDSLREATDWLLAAEDQQDRLAGASPYLEMFGLVAGGWVMARSAAKAGLLLASGEGDADFLKAKVATCRFYCDQILPQATGLLPAVTSGAGQLSDAL